jgi:tetratricopeptide (TPR) repeat protein
VLRRRTLTEHRAAALPEGIRRQLQRLGVRRGSDLEGRPSRPAPPAPATVPEGILIETGAGTCFLVEEAYPLGHCHGHFPLGALLEEPLEPWAALAAGPLSSPLALSLPSPLLAEGRGGREGGRRGLLPHPAALTFLDIETTGLSDGAGTYAFLVGLGQFSGDSFRLSQFFLRSPLEERALLLAVAEALRRGQGVVTFNGRGFDLPVLVTRYTLARLPLPWAGQVYLDLLLPARRLWRPRLVQCSLSSLEQNLLGVERSFLDVPGWRIPSVYRDYLRGADASVLQPIFYHNAQDVLSMVTLATRLARFLGDPWGEGGARHGLEFCALGRFYEQGGQLPEAIAAYRAALLLALPVPAREQTWERLAALLKRQQAWEEAVAVWQALVDRPGDHPLYAYVELAKYYEHRCRDLDRAEALVRRAVAEYGADLADLTRRLERLQQKKMRRGTTVFKGDAE